MGICAQYYERVLSCTRMDRLFATSRLHFAYAIGNMFAALRIGASNILLERWATAPSVAETVERFKPTVMLSVPAVYHRLLDAGLAPLLKRSPNKTPKNRTGRADSTIGSRAVSGGGRRATPKPQRVREKRPTFSLDN